MGGARAVKGRRKLDDGCGGHTEGRSPSETEKMSFGCTEGYGLLRDVKEVVDRRGSLGQLGNRRLSLLQTEHDGSYEPCRLNAPDDDGWHQHRMRTSPPSGIRTVGLFVKSPASCDAFCC